MFEEMYAPDERDRKVFGELYDPPECFVHGQWHRVATVRKDPKDSDGCDVEIDESRLPVRFWRLRPLRSVNSIGDTKEPVAFMETGSGDEMGELVLAIARAMSQGMLQFEPAPSEEQSHE